MRTAVEIARQTYRTVTNTGRPKLVAFRRWRGLSPNALNQEKDGSSKESIKYEWVFPGGVALTLYFPVAYREEGEA